MNTGDPRGAESSETPSSLCGYLKGNFAASKYYKKLETTLGAPSEPERAAALELCNSDPALLAKVVELARLASNDKGHSRIQKSIRRLASDIIRSSDPELAKWGLLADASPDGQLGILATRLRKTRKGKDKSEIARDEQILLLGLAVTSTRIDFDVAASLFTVFVNLNPDKPDKRSLDDRVTKFALRASPRLLESLGSLTRLVRLAAGELEEHLMEMKRDLEASRERTRDLQDKNRTQIQQLKEMQVERDQLAKRLEETEGKIAGVKGGRDQDMIELRARFRKLLTKTLRPNLEEAFDALEHSPSVTEVAIHRIKVANRDIEKELEWMSQYSD